MINQNCMLASKTKAYRTFNALSVLFLQGSYGVVKLAYNEDSEQYYVSRNLCVDNLCYMSGCHDHQLLLLMQAMKVVSKKKLMRQCGFLRECKIQPLLSECLMSFDHSCGAGADVFVSTVSSQAAYLLKGQTPSRIHSLKPCCLWTKCTRRLPS